VDDESHNYSEKLAGERGSFPNWKGSTWDTKHHRPMRNATCSTVAPTGTISIIGACSGGIEPLYSLAFYRNVLRGQTEGQGPMIETNPIFEAVAREQGFFSEGLMERLATDGTLAKIQDVPEEVRKRQVRNEVKGRNVELVNRQRHRAIPLLHKAAFGWPERPNRHPAEEFHQLVECRVDLAERVAPDREQAAGLQHAPRLAQEALDVHPVQRLRRRDELRACTLKPTVVRGHAIRDARVRLRQLELSRARVRTDDPRETIGQPRGGLPVACPAVPR